MLLWFLSKPMRPFGTIQRGWSSILGRVEVPRTSCFKACFQLEWKSFFYFIFEGKGREGNPTFLSTMLLWLQGQSLSHINEHCMAQAQHILTATLQGLFLVCPVFLPLLYPSLHPQRASAVFSWNYLLCGDLWKLSACIHWTSCFSFLSQSLTCWRAVRSSLRLMALWMGSTASREWHPTYRSWGKGHVCECQRDSGTSLSTYLALVSQVQTVANGLQMQKINCLWSW